MRVVFTGGVFTCRCNYDERHIPKEVGFRWDKEQKVWYTPSHGVAARLESFLDESAKHEIAKVRLMIDTWTRPLSIPKDEKLLPFQENAVLFALARNRSYLALDPGLGKTPVAAVIAQTLDDQNPVAGLYICPPFLTRNTESEFFKWSPQLGATRYNEFSICSWFCILPDSILTRHSVQKDILKFTKDAEAKGLITILFVDEAHRFKNDEAARTKALFGFRGKIGIAHLFNKIVYLSGTPMPNRPIELFPVLNHSAPQTIQNMSKHEYAEKYCGAFQNRWGWDYSGSSNVKELVANVIGTFMLRYKKSEVLKELPQKLEEMVVLSEKLPPRLEKLSERILSQMSPDDLMKGQIQVSLDKDVLHLSTYRKELGAVKVQAASDYIKYLLEETDDSILVFAIHKDVIWHLNKELSKYHPLVITGDTRMELRDAYVKEFQNNERRRVFIGNIQAAGTGLTLTKATRVVFAEFSWVPADNDQAADRAHRIGQTDNVFVQYLVLENSIDKAVIETVLRKKKITALL